ncbi:hypothetical protein ABIF91_004579, partial [Bradyrhizobium sp. USDA 241]
MKRGAQTTFNTASIFRRVFFVIMPSVDQTIAVRR